MRRRNERYRRRRIRTRQRRNREKTKTEKNKCRLEKKKNKENQKRKERKRTNKQRKINKEKETWGKREKEGTCFVNISLRFLNHKSVASVAVSRTPPPLFTLIGTSCPARW